jgi:hypothetical protein
MLFIICFKEPPKKKGKYRPINLHYNAIYFFDPAQFQNIPIQNIIDYLSGIAHNYQMVQ